MQDTAPGSSGALQAGHSVGVGGALVSAVAPVAVGAAAGGAGGRAGGPGGAGGRAGAEGAGPTLAPTPAPTAATAGAAAPAVNGFWQEGQRKDLPAELSGNCMALEQLGQRK